jgi:ribonucleoside-triphosphate reductase
MTTIQEVKENKLFQVKNDPPFDTMGLFTYLRTYARRHDEENPSSTIETWQECLSRVVNACNSQLNVGFSEEEEQEIFDLMYNLKCVVAGRFLWQLGTKTVDRLGMASLQNCTFIIIDEPVEPFVWIMNFLLLGAGVGFRILPSDVEKLPIVKKSNAVRLDTKDADYIVPDSREGWVKLFGKVLKSHFYSGKDFTYSCTLLRSKGAPIKTFGGIASGPDILCEGMYKIDKILNLRENKKLRPIDVLDIINIIGQIVVSGNIRRSAQLAIGDCKDTDFLNAKNWENGNIPNWRAFSNNSVICNDIEDILNDENFWKGYEGHGEPYGLINMDLSRKCGRLGETQYPDLNAGGYNPCCEQTLNTEESCCLAEIFLPNISSKEELFKCSTYLYRICKHSLTLPCKNSEKTEKIVHKNMRMGIGVTGYLQATEEQKSWLSDCYVNLRKFDVEYSMKHNFPPSIKLCTTKPSGCSRKDMLVQTDKGLLRLDEIGDIKGKEWQNVKGINVYTDNDKIEKITKFYINGKVPTKIILTEDGNELESSLNHQYRVVNEKREYVWKTVDKLKEGDQLVVRLGNHPENIITPLKFVNLQNNTNCQRMKQPEVLTKDLAWFLGLFYGDGSVHDKGIRISFNRKQPALLQWLKTFFDNTFGLKPSIDDDHSFYVNSVQLLKWLEENECLKSYSHNLCLPKIIRQASKENAIAFIDGLWRADGGIHTSTNSWSVCTVSKEFSNELLHLCRSVGYNMKITNAGPGGLGSKDRWILSYRKMEKKKLRYVSKEMKNRIYGDFWLDPIVSIQDSECETYDIEVANVHHYKLNGVISHNSLSILGGTTPGVHPAFSRFYRRRIRIASGSPLLKIAKDHGYHVEYALQFDGTPDHTTQIVSFPMSYPEHSIFGDKCSAIQQMEYVKRLQTEWSDNSVSVTVYYKKEELPEIKEWLRKNYNTSVKTISFLLHSDHHFSQAPFEKITEEEYNEMVLKCKPITNLDGICYTENDEDNLEVCTSGICPTR